MTKKVFASKRVKSLLVSKLISTQEKGMDVQLEVTEPIEELAIDSISLVRILESLNDYYFSKIKKHQNALTKMGSS